jgi:acyl-homoserine lactone acylase PvdQ
MRRQISLFLLMSIVMAAFVSPAQAQDPAPPEVTDTLRAYNITPPGQEGNVTTDEVVTDDFGPHYQDQLGMYAALVDDENVTDDELENYFHTMQFGPAPGDVDSTYNPTEGVSVFRDASFGVPHIYADSMEKASFGLGYVAAEDRLFQMDVFRHAARGTLAAFVGPGDNDANLKMDIDTRREGYTPEEITNMYNSMDERYGDVGKTLQDGLAQYAAGVNAFIDEVKSDPSRMPAEYPATNNPPPVHPEEWTPEDTLFIVVLQLRVFGETAGTELKNAALLTHLQKRMGKKQGKALFNDLLFQNDPKSPTTLNPKDADFRTQRTGKVDPKSIAVPDAAVKVGEEVAARDAVRWGVLESLGFRKQMSNALLVSGEKSATGNPLLTGGPQVGHSVPSFFLDVDVHAPGVDFRGPAVPGTNALIPLGRGADYAWTLTTGYSDAVDTRAEKLCDPEGGKAKLDSTGYIFRGKCKKMNERTETFDINPQPSEPGPPRESEEHTFYRTQHGPVFERAKVNGKPVAFVKERFFWKKEVGSLPSFYKWNTGIETVEDFKAAAKGFTMSFNSFYADSEHIGYFHVGQYPLRRKGMSLTLPTWGTGKWEWRGRRAYKLQPKIVDPGQGWLSNWNNKPARHWNNQDGFKWGSIQRMKLLSDKMHKLLDNGKAELADLANVLGRAATQDARGVYLAPRMVALAKGTGSDSLLKYVSDWVKAGAHRSNTDHDENMDAGTALAFFDAWYDGFVHRVFDDELGEKGYELLAAVDAPTVNYHPASGGGFFFDFSSYLRNLLERKSRARAFHRNVCDVKGTKKKESCRDQLLVALRQAKESLKSKQGSDISKWTVPAENMSFSKQGYGDVDPIPWQNRGTENHLVEVLTDAG